MRLHDLRQGRASQLVASGTDIALVSQVLGHSGIAVAADTYAHLLLALDVALRTQPMRSFLGRYLTSS